MAISGQGSKLLIILSKCEKVNKETYAFINARKLRISNLVHRFEKRTKNMPTS